MGLISTSNLTSTYQQSDMYSLSNTGPLLQKGSDNTIEVLKVQKNLESLGYSTEGENGYFGESTQSALKAFQKDFGLQTTGIADSQTLGKLNEVVTSDSQAIASDSFSKSPDLVYGSQGQAVGDLQLSLKKLGYFSASVDSYFGASTEGAVKAFQSNNGLQDTGIVDGDTKLAISRGLSNISITANTYSSYVSYKEAYIPQGTGTLESSSNLMEDGSVRINNTSSSVSDTGGGSGSTSEVEKWKAAWDSNNGYIQKGNNNDSVKYLQHMLTKLGFLKDVVDGIFGNNTLNAVKSFQSSQGLSADGIVGPKTKESINKVFSQKFGTNTVTPPVTPTNPGTDVSAADEAKWKSAWDLTGTLAYGSKGDAVKFLQLILKRANALNDVIDGDFGAKTFEAVKSFQNVHMLAVDGVVGANTRKTIDVMYANRNTTSIPTTPTGTTITSDQEAQWKRAWDASGTLSTGSKGDAVKFLQLILTRTHAFNGLIDGDFGSITLEGVKSFQNTHMLKLDGIVGSDTKRCIDLIYANRDTTVMPTILPGTTVTPEQEAKWKSAWDAGATLTKGSTGDAVRYLQLMLRKVHPFSGAIDGIFGDETYEAVCGYQNTHILKVDGIVGAQTRNSINKVYADSKLPIITGAGPIVPPSPSDLEKQRLKLKLMSAANKMHAGALSESDSFEKSVDIFLELFPEYQKGHYLKGTYTYLDDPFKSIALNHWTSMVIDGKDATFFAGHLMPDEYFNYYIPDKAPMEDIVNGVKIAITSENKYNSKAAQDFYEKYYYALDLFHEVNYKIAVAAKTSTVTTTTVGGISPTIPTVPTAPSTTPGISITTPVIPTLKTAISTIGTSTPSVMPRNSTYDIALARPTTITDDINPTPVPLEGINPGRAVLETYQTNNTSAAKELFNSRFSAWALSIYGPNSTESIGQFGLSLVMGAVTVPMEDTLFAIEGTYEFLKNKGWKDLPQFGKAIKDLLFTEKGRESLKTMVKQAKDDWFKAYGEAPAYEKGRMVGKVVGQILSAVLVADATCKAVKEVTTGFKVLKALDSFADFVSLARKTLKSAPERIFENVKSVFRSGDDLKIVDCNGTEMLLDRVQLKSSLKADGMADDAIESAMRTLEEGCFAGDTLILTRDGNKRIDEIQVGDYVLSKDVNTGETTYKKVQQVYIKSADKFIRLNIGDDIIRTTPSHLFFTDSGWWKAADNIKAGDKIVISNGEIKEVYSAELEELEEHERIYNINVEDYHTYFVGGMGVLVHNECSVAKAALTAKRVAENMYFSQYTERIKYTPGDSSSLGKWIATEGQEAIRGESKFVSANTEVNEILKNYGLDGINYTDGIPDFSKVVATKNDIRAEVKISNMSTSRVNNYSTADKALAEKWGMSQADIETWRKENGFTWHELNDVETMQLIPTKINGEFKHVGGVGELKCKFKLGGDLGE